MLRKLGNGYPNKPKHQIIKSTKPYYKTIYFVVILELDTVGE